LAEIRQQLGLTQTQLAEAIGLSRVRISQIENGDAWGSTRCLPMSGWAEPV
jgi:transcriptional regulator with XRE-family HTH domain